MHGWSMMVKIVEIFDSIQGEGRLIGMGHTFVRLAGCNLSCKWCDTKYALGDEGYHASVSDILLKIRCEHVCITGGEPLIQDVYGLCKVLFDAGKKVTIETNCTVYDERLFEFVFLYSVSPKLSSSGERFDEGVLSSYLNLDNCQLKFVVCDDNDFFEVVEIVKKYSDFVRDKVIVQPEGLCSLEEYQRRLLWLVDKVMGNSMMIENNVRVLPQLHKIVWGDKRGV